MRKTAYIGITGVKSLDESSALLRLARDLPLPPSHRLMIGGLASYKSLRLGYVADPSQYILPTELNETLICDPQIMNIVHYNSRHDELLEQIRNVLEVVYNAEGIQLNIEWPNPEILRVLRNEGAPIVVLQVSAAASEVLDHDPVRLARRLAEYEGLIDYALIDPSGGTGQGFDPEYGEAVLSELVKTDLSIQWGIAGGLGPGRLDGLVPLLELYPELSWDAQARLRTTDGSALDLVACEQYMREGIALLHKLPERS